MCKHNSKQTFLYVATLLCLLAGCKSDAERLRELRAQEAWHSLRVQNFESGQSLNLQTYKNARDSLDLVRRDIARLLR